MGYAGFPSFECANACGRKVGVRGNKCQKCRDREQFGRLREAIPPEILAERYVESMNESRAKKPRRAKH